MTPASVTKAVRNRLGDSRQERWDDATLLLYISLCQNDICMFTHYYRKSALITLEVDKLIYDLPTDCIAANRFEYNDKLLNVETRNSIDAGNAQFPLILKDNLEQHKVQFMVGDTYADLESALIGVFGVVTTTEDLDPVYGVVTTVGEELPSGGTSLGEFKVFYSATPALLEMVDDGLGNLSLPTEPLLIPDIWFQAMLHFVTGMCLQDDNDANNIQRGELEASKYIRVLQHIQKVSSKDFTSNIRTKLTTPIRRV